MPCENMTNTFIKMKGSLKCPVCGYKKAHVYRYINDMYFGGIKKWCFFIKCDNCETSSCEYLSDEAVIGAWEGKSDSRLLHSLFPEVEDIGTLRRYPL